MIYVNVIAFNKLLFSYNFFFQLFGILSAILISYIFLDEDDRCKLNYLIIINIFIAKHI